MASRSSVAANTKKARKLALEEMLYIQSKGVSADYESGRIPWPDHVVKARKDSWNYRNNRAKTILEQLGIL